MIINKNIDTVLLLGGSRATAELSKLLKEQSIYKYITFTCERQLKDIIYPNGTTFQEYLDTNQISYISTENINTCPEFIDSISDTTIAIGLGEAWSFDKTIIDKFGGRLVDLMGIRLPQYRGGAHYTWQILRGNRIGACNLQIINEDMVQGFFDSGEIIASKEYFFSTNARIPNDYFEEAVEQEIKFIIEFLAEIKKGKTFKPFRLQEQFSIYFPRLNTYKQAFIDWSWSTLDIDRFICAFDDPYMGASTFINGKRVFLKKSQIESNDGSFHPFQIGLIYKIDDKAIYIASKAGTIIIKEVMSETNIDIKSTLKHGMRFYTPKENLEEALLLEIKY